MYSIPNLDNLGKQRKQVTNEIHSLSTFAIGFGDYRERQNIPKGNHTLVKMGNFQISIKKNYSQGFRAGKF